MSDKPRDFLSLALAGKVMMDEIDDFVSDWHAGESDKELHEYLGMTWDEYALWVASADVLPLIITSRKLNRPLDEVTRDNLQVRLAARSDDPAKVKLIQRWLNKRNETRA